MSENLRKYINGIYTLNAVAQRVPADAWDNTSCCEGWTAREAAGHAAWLVRNVGNLAVEAGPTAEVAEAEVLGQDPAAGMRDIISTTMAQLDTPGSLQRVAVTPFGEMPIDQFIGIVWVDPLVHSWDVADAAGIDHGIDQASATDAFNQLSPLLDNLRGPGLFAEATDAAGNDPVSTLIALTGRSSVRS